VEAEGHWMLFSPVAFWQRLHVQADDFHLQRQINFDQSIFTGRSSRDMPAINLSLAVLDENL
jgi:hypothetical protein